MKKSIKISLVILLLGVIITGVVVYDALKVKKFSISGFAMTSVIDQTLYGTDKRELSKISQQTFTELDKFEKEFSMYIEGSDIYKINEGAGSKKAQVSPYTADLLMRAKAFSAQSNGNFDITVAPATLAWGVNSDNPRVPSNDELQKIIELIDYNSIEINAENNTVFLKNAGQGIDLGAVAKGEACNIVRDVYKQNGVTAGLISIGGNIMVMGEKPDGKSFVIGVRDPRGTQNDYVGTLAINNTVVSTSGDYERLFKKDGKSYHHIMNPATAAPAESDLMSVTVVCSDGARADYMSTALFVGGLNYAKTFMQGADKPYGVIAIDKEYNVYVSENLKQSFKPNENAPYNFVM